MTVLTTDIDQHFAWSQDYTHNVCWGYGEVGTSFQDLFPGPFIVALNICDYKIITSLSQNDVALFQQVAGDYPARGGAWYLRRVWRD